MKSIKKNRGFGLLFFIVFLLIGLWPVFQNNAPRIFFFPIALIFLVLGITNSKLLTPFNNFWIKFGEFLGRFISPIVMFLIYFLLITPISLILRVFKKDLLNLKIIA